MNQGKRLDWPDVVILAATLIVLTVGLDRYGLYEPHEGHFAGVAREMLLRGDWVTPTLNGAPYLNKPPLLYWLVAASIQLLGFTEFACRLPLAISGWLGVVVAGQWARSLWGLAAGRVVVLMLSATLGWFIFIHQLLIDALLASLMLAMFYCLWRLAWEPQPWRYCFGLYGLLGLGILAKGFLGLVFFCLGCTALALNRRSFKVLRKLKLVPGIGITLTITLPWFIAVEQANPGFLQYLLINEHFKRVMDTRWPPDYEVSTISPWGYLALTALWGIPWVFLLPQTVTSTWRDWQQGQHTSASLADRHRSEGILLLVIAATAPVVLFLPLSSRLIYYSVPAIAPFVILC
ncbi:MAG TPA: glycosyltransferase family 39 protein, partial [Candidatus Caenarcaniphilales bacterium]